jgi:PhnB protein
MPLEKTFWAARFGTLIDRFGMSWVINGAEPDQSGEE